MIRQTVVSLGARRPDVYVAPDYIYLTLTMTPDHAPNSLVNKIKEVAARYLQENVSSLRKQPVVWTDSRYVVVAPLWFQGEDITAERAGAKPAKGWPHKPG